MAVSQMAMGHNLWLHFGVDARPFATYFDVHQGYHWFGPTKMACPNRMSNQIEARMSKWICKDEQIAHP